MAKAQVLAAGAAAPLASAISSTRTQVRERKIGDLFEYQIEHPVTIRRNQSALVPILLRGFEGRSVLLYNKDSRKENPLRSVEFKNTTGLTLEGGPVTVMESGNYVGEAMLDTLKPDEQRLIPYAVELSVCVLDSIDSHDEKVYQVVIRRGQLRAYYGRVQQTTYTVNNKGNAEQVLYLEHPRQGNDWKLFDTAAPKETTENHWRFCFSLPAATTSRFVIRQKHVLEQVFALGDLKEQQLSFWLEQRYLDQKTASVLGEVLAARQEAAKHEEQTTRLEKEREQIYNEQKRIRENLQALGDRPSEKDLRERWVRVLNTQEDRLEKIAAEIKELFAARARCQETVNELLAKLEYEASLA